MADRSHLYLAVYDVTNDRERTRVANLLEGYGVRIQKSVFEIRANRALRRKILRDVAALKLASGTLALYRIDEARPRVTASGRRRPTRSRMPITPGSSEGRGGRDLSLSIPRNFV